MDETKEENDNSNEINEEVIISKFMDYVVQKEHFPDSLSKFCEETDITTDDFYLHFEHIESLKKKIWVEFLSQTISVCEKDPNYDQFEMRDKVLTLFFTLFELLTANRKYIELSLRKEGFFLTNILILSDLRKFFKSYMELLLPKWHFLKDPFLTIRNTSASEVLWLQFIFLLDFWLKDISANFDNTDIAIEKSVKAVFDATDTTPIESVIDFGKFIWKERKS